MIQLATIPATTSVHTIQDTRLPAQVRALVFVRDQGLLVLWLVLVLVFAIWGQPYFFSMQTGLSVLNAAAITAIIAAGIGVGVMTGALDLSVPGTAAVAGVVVALLLTSGVPVWPAILAGLAVGVAVGIVNGLVVVLGFDPLIVTIAMLAVLSGLALVIAGGYNVSGLTQLAFLGTQSYLGIPAPVYVTAALFTVLTVFLKMTRSGMRLLAVGGNAEAARRVGISVGRYKVLGFVICGFCAALGGIVNASYIATASPTASVSVIFTAITAVALAGVPFSGGRGSLPRVLLGAIVLATIGAGLLLADVETYWSSIIQGLLLIGGLALNRGTSNAVFTVLAARDLVARAKGA